MKFIEILIIIFPIIAVVSPKLLAFVLPVVGLLYSIFYLVKYKSLPFKNLDLRVITILMIFFAFAACSYFWSVNPENSIEKVIKTVLAITTSVFIIAIILEKQSVEPFYVTKYMPISVIIASIILLIETYFGYPIYHTVRNIPYDEIVAPARINSSVVAVSVLIWPAIYIAWQNKKLPIIASIAILATIMVFSSDTQTAMLGLILSSIAFLIATKLPKLLLKTIAILTFVGILLSPWIAQLLYNYPPSIFVNWSSASAAPRMEVWDYVARYALNSPIYGWGIEATRNIHDFQSAKIFYQVTEVNHPHNFAIQLWIELGAIGAILGSVFIYLFTNMILRVNVDKLKFLTASFVNILVINLFGYGMWQGWLIGLELMLIFIYIYFFKITEHKKA